MIHRDRRVICASGDGGLMMHLYTLEMARELDLPVSFIVLNNSCLGNVRDFRPPERRIATEYPRPDFARIAQGFGLEGVTIEKPEELGGAVKDAHESDKPCVIDVVVDDLPHFKLMAQ
jgi:thiamine pyrophosphate-dependent acetolactate synthase large subunit-like protein